MDTVLFIRYNSTRQPMLEERLQGVNGYARDHGWHVQTVDRPAPAQLRRLFDLWHPCGVIVESGSRKNIYPPRLFGKLPFVYLDRDAETAAKRAALDLAALGSLTFRRPDPSRFPCIGLVKEALAMGGCAPAVLAAADELAVARFLRGEIGFADIAKTVERALGRMPKTPCDSLEAVFAAADWAGRSL